MTRAISTHLAWLEAQPDTKAEKAWYQAQLAFLNHRKNSPAHTAIAKGSSEASAVPIRAGDTPQPEALG